MTNTPNASTNTETPEETQKNSAQSNHSAVLGMNFRSSAKAAFVAELKELLDVVEPASIVNVILQRAFEARATDIHLDPTTLGVRIRFRVDGMLQDIIPIPAATAAVLISRLKVMAGMDFTDRRMPQDGAIPAAKFPGLPRDVRVGSSLTVNGERLVLRLMPDTDALNSLATLGFYEDQFMAVKTLQSSPYGLLLVVGPVGSGKTTTAHALLRELNTTDRSLVTIEDPVERRLPGANQIQVDLKAGLNFVTALRATLRQDPNVLFIGEIRDAETAKIACRAATTGMLVMSTVHANNTATAIEVLREFGISSATIADCLRGVISQRLVRIVCPQFREEISPNDDEFQLLKLSPDDRDVKIANGLPSDANFGTGYSGRTAVFETMVINRDLQSAIVEGASPIRLRELAQQSSMATLEDATRRKVLDKITSIEELRRVISDAEMARG